MIRISSLGTYNRLNPVLAKTLKRLRLPVFAHIAIDHRANASCPRCMVEILFVPQRLQGKNSGSAEARACNREDGDRTQQKAPESESERAGSIRAECRLNPAVGREGENAPDGHPSPNQAKSSEVQAP